MSEVRKGTRVRERYAPSGCHPYTGTVEYVAQDGWIGVRLDSERSRVISVERHEIEPISDAGNPALATLRHHVSGAIERGEAETITEQRAPVIDCDGHYQQSGHECPACGHGSFHYASEFADGRPGDMTRVCADCGHRAEVVCTATVPYAIAPLTWETCRKLAACVRMGTVSGDTGHEYGPTRLDMYESHAYERGQSDASAAATWITDGNESDESRRLKLAALDDGDPAADDFMSAPNLSGEFADGLTPLVLARTITGEEDPDAETVDALADAYETGVSETYGPACEAELLRWVPNTVERMLELRAQIDDARRHGRDPQRQLCELADLAETEEGAAFGEFADALAHFKHETARLARAWEDVSGDILGDSYGLPESFEEIAEIVSAWEIKR